METRFVLWLYANIAFERSVKCNRVHVLYSIILLSLETGGAAIRRVADSTFHL